MSTASSPRVKVLVQQAVGKEKARRFHEAAALYRQAASLCRRAGDGAAQAAATLRGGVALALAGFDAQAAQAFQRAISGSEVLGDDVSAAHARMMLGRHHLDHQRFAEAARALGRCVEVLRDHHAHDEVGWVADRLVAIRRRAGDLEGALNYARVALEAASAASDRHRYGLRVAALGTLHRRAGHDGPARAYLTKALPHLRDSGHHDALHRALWALAEMAESRGDDDERLECLEEALVAAIDAGQVVARARAELALAEGLREEDRSRMRGLVIGATVRLYACPVEEVRAATWLKLAALQGQIGDRAQANRALRRARATSGAS